MKKINNTKNNLLNKGFHISHRKTPNPLRAYKHQHNAYEIMLCNSGNGSFFIKNKSYPIEKYSLFLIDKFDIHLPKLAQDTKHFDRFVIQFKPDFIEKISLIIENDINPLEIFAKNINFVKLKHNEYKSIKNLSEKIIFEIKKTKPGYKSLVNIYMLRLIIIIFRIINKKANNFKSTENKNENRLQKIIYYINENYTKNLTLKQIADEFHISKYYLCHYFKDKTGFTVVEFVNNTRIINAQKMLINTDMNITDIAMEVGYNSLSNFERVFKKINGITPSQYRSMTNSNFKSN